MALEALEKKYPDLIPQDKWCGDGNLDKSIIKEISIADRLPDSVKGDVEIEWDVSAAQDGSIKACLLDGGAKVIIAGNGSGKILADTSMKKMFADFEALERITGLKEVLDTRNVTDMSYLFHHCISLRELDLSGWDVSQVTNFRGTFCCGYDQIGNAKLKKLDISGWDVSGAGDMAYMFYGCGNLVSVDVGSWNTGNVKNFRHTFADCFKLKKLDVGSWDTHSVITLDGIFNDCRSLKEIDVSSWDTSTCREFDQLFDNCINLRHVKGIEKLNTKNGISFEEMFFGCRKLTRLDLSSINTDRVDGTEFTAYESGIKSRSTVKNILTGCNDLKNIIISPSLVKSLRATEKNALLDKIDEAGFIVISPKTGSMMPILRPGIDQAAFYLQDSFEKDDIVLFKSGYSSNLVMHRIFRVMSTGYLIKGDRDRYAEFVPKENIYAGARQIYRDGKAIQRRSFTFMVLSVYSKGYNVILDRYRRSDCLFWRATRRIKRKIFR